MKDPRSPSSSERSRWALSVTANEGLKSGNGSVDQTILSKLSNCALEPATQEPAVSRISMFLIVRPWSDGACSVSIPAPPSIIPEFTEMNVSTVMASLPSPASMSKTAGVKLKRSSSEIVSLPVPPLMTSFPTSPQSMPAETVRQAFILAALEAGVTINDDEDGAEASALNPAV